MRILSYNLLYGAGVERQFDSALPGNLAGINRLPQIMSYVKAANPDIWGIQEANGWDRQTPPVIRQVAQELGMRYVLVKTPGGFHLALLTKFEIIETVDLSSQVGRQGVLKAVLRTADGARLNLFLVHLDPSSADARWCEVSTLVQLMQPYLTEKTVLMGDMNFQPMAREWSLLEQAGWKPVAAEKVGGIDQIWISSAVDWSTSPWFQSLPVPTGLSDHNPIGAEIKIYRSSIVLPRFAPSTPAPVIQVPSWVSETLGTRIQRFNGFDSACSYTRWTSRGKTEKWSGETLEIAGEASWQASVSRYKIFSAGEGVLLRFQFTRGAEFEFSFDNGLWNTAKYRRFGFNLREDAAQGVVWQGATGIRGENLTGNLYPQPDTWYDLLLALDRPDEFIVEVRDPREPGQRLRYRGRMDDPGPEPSWIFGIGADKGKLMVNHYTEISIINK